MRGTMAMEGVVVVGVDVIRRSAGDYGLGCGVRVTTRGMWTDEGKLPAELTAVRRWGFGGGCEVRRGL